MVAVAAYLSLGEKPPAPAQAMDTMASAPAMAASAPPLTEPSATEAPASAPVSQAASAPASAASAAKPASAALEVLALAGAASASEAQAARAIVAVASNDRLNVRIVFSLLVPGAPPKKAHIQSPGITCELQYNCKSGKRLEAAKLQYT